MFRFFLFILWIGLAGCAGLAGAQSSTQTQAGQGQSAPAQQKPATPGQQQGPGTAQQPAAQQSAPEIHTVAGQLAVKPAPPTPIAVQKAELGEQNNWNPEWDKIIEKALPAELLSPRREREVKSLCPRFKYMSETDKRAFWAYFFQALAGAEAGLTPTTDVKHSEPEVAVVDTVTKRMVRSEGLLQLTYMDGPRYGCEFDWDKDKELPEHDPAKTILQPTNNLLCGVKILENQLITQHKPVLSKSSYWVTLRPHHPSFFVFIKQMKNEPQSCGPTRVRRGLPPADLTEPPPMEQAKGSSTSNPPSVADESAGSAAAATASQAAAAH
jgi:hypothetical protein